MEILQANDKDNTPRRKLDGGNFQQKTQSNPVRKREENRNIRKKNNGFSISNCIIHLAHCQKRQQRTQRKVRQPAFLNHHQYT